MIDLTRKPPFKIYRWIDDIEEYEVRTVTRVVKSLSSAYYGHGRSYLPKAYLAHWFDTEEAAIEDWIRRAQIEINADFKQIDDLNERISESRGAIARASERLEDAAKTADADG
jgi:hypothetical protein